MAAPIANNMDWQIMDNNFCGNLCISSQEFTGTLKLAYFCILIFFLHVAMYKKIETSAQKRKIAESAYFTHFPSQILISQLHGQRVGACSHAANVCLEL